MTREDLSDYLVAHGCEMRPYEGVGPAIVVFHNPKTGRSAFIKAPLDETVTLEATVFKICYELGIEPPNYAKNCKTVMDNVHKRFPSKHSGKR